MSVHDTMRLTLFINPTGHHQAAWRHPGTDADAGINLAHYVHLAQTAERAGFDALFLADNASTREGAPDVVSRAAQYIAWFEPTTLLAALAMATERIGLVCTIGTSLNEPYHVARRMASLDHISGGRAGWNIVTSGSATEWRNFGHDDIADEAYRYDKAAEFVEVCLGLWDSWDDDAFLYDRENGRYFDPSKVRQLNHQGEFFKVAGPLNIPRCPQGRPLLVQAGASPVGRDFAAHYADMVFATPLTLEGAVEVRNRTRDIAAGYGRNPDDIAIMPGLPLIVGRTDAEAQARYQELQDLLHPDVTINILSLKTTFDLTGLPLDEPLPADAGDMENSHFRDWYELGEREGLTLRQLAQRASGSRAGMETVKGSPETVADLMEEWFHGGGCDGFNIMPAYLPGGLDDIAELLIPELRRRGLVREQPEGRMLREHFGLKRPDLVHD